MIKIENKLLLLLALLMASVVALSNYLVQFPIKYFDLENLLTYGAFSYPIAFLITDLANRTYGKQVAFGYYHYPLPFHKEADEAAIASECAGEQASG